MKFACIDVVLLLVMCYKWYLTVTVVDSQYRYTALGACPGVTITYTNLELPVSINGVQHRPPEHALKRKASENNHNIFCKRVRDSEHLMTDSSEINQGEPMVDANISLR